MMAWLRRHLSGPTATEDHLREEAAYHERVDKVEDLSVRLRTKRERNGFGHMFETAFHAPRQGGHRS